MKKVFLLVFILIFMAQTPIVFAQYSPEKEISKQAMKLFKKAEKLIKSKEFDKAMTKLDEAIQIEPDFSDAYFLKAQVLYSQKQNEQVVELLQKTISLNPNNSQASVIMAKILTQLAQQEIRKQNIHKAITLYEKVIEIPNLETIDNKLTINGLYQLGQLQYNVRDFLKSKELFLKLSGLKDIQTNALKTYLISQYMLGMSCMRLNQKRESNEHFKNYISLNTENPTDQFLPLAHFLIGQNLLDELTEEAEIIKKDEKKDKKKRIASLAKTKEDIIIHTEKAISLNEKLEPAYMNLGNYYYYLNDLDNTIKYYQTLSDKFPESKDITTYNSFLEKIKKEKKETSKKNKT
jgi:tetratricopeptide (TPR) repeat protein